MATQHLRQTFGLLDVDVRDEAAPPGVKEALLEDLSGMPGFHDQHGALRYNR